MSAFSTGDHIGGVEAIYVETLGTGITVELKGFFLFLLPAFKRFFDRWKITTKVEERLHVCPV
jgi:hypothetical protein